MKACLPLLTIAIPTYNRAKLLEERLLELIPQLTSEVELIICNDGSTDETEQIWQKYREHGVLYYENKVNMGLSRNMLLAFESAKGDWLWTLGDDDGVLSTAIQNALALVKNYEHAGVITFSNDTLNFDHEHEYHKLGDFLNRQGITDVMFQSSNLYHIRKINKHLKTFAQGIITVSPHLDLIFRMLEDNTASIQFSQVELLGECDSNRRWSSLELALGISLHPNFIRDPEIRKQAAISAWFKTRWMHKYGLREVSDSSSLIRWRQLTRSCNLLLKSYGVNSYNIISFNQFEFQEFYDNIMLFPFKVIPFFLLKAPILSMRNRRSGDKVSCDN